MAQPNETSVEDETDRAAAAIAYAKRGYRVLPLWPPATVGCSCPAGASCRSSGKHPVTDLAPRGLDDASSDPEVVASWWQRHHGANIGLVTGGESGLLVLDVDGPDGEASLAELQKHGLLPGTLTQTTGRGRHLFFRAPAGLRNRVRLMPGLDVRADRGYVVVSPSVHENGKRYEWDHPLGLDGDITEAPTWLLERVREPAPREDAVPAYTSIPEGQRNDRLFRHACKLRAEGLDEAAIFQALMTLDVPRCAPALDENEVRSIAASAARYPPNEVPPPDTAQLAIQAGDAPVAGEGADTADLSRSVAAQLVEIARPAGTFFHTPDDRGYVAFERGGHREVLALRSKGYASLLKARYYAQTGRPPSPNAVEAAIDTLEGVAQFEGEALALGVRVARRGDVIYIDLGDPTWQMIEVTPSGWSIPQTPPIVFRRTAGMEALPRPEKGGTLADLRPFLSGNDDEFRLAVGWILGALGGVSPYPILDVQGEQGSGKSIFSRVMRAMVDPVRVGLRAMPREERDLMVAANNAHVVAYDNVSAVPIWLADGLCRVSTGGGFGTRELYSDAEEVVFDVTRPVIINGIPDLLTRPDLADRALVIRLQPMDDSARRSEAEFWASFQNAHPRIFGVLLDALACALRRRAEVKLPTSPRMADFTAWVVAASPSLGWNETEFIDAYQRNQAEAIEAGLETDAVANAVAHLLGDCSAWRGTPTELLEELTLHASESLLRGPGWPRTAHALSGHLNRLAPALRRVGIVVGRGRTGEARWISLETKGGATTPGRVPLLVQVAPARRPEVADGTVPDIGAILPIGYDGPDGEALGSDARDGNDAGPSPAGSGTSMTS